MGLVLGMAVAPLPPLACSTGQRLGRHPKRKLPFFSAFLSLVLGRMLVGSWLLVDGLMVAEGMAEPGGRQGGYAAIWWSLGQVVSLATPSPPNTVRYVKLQCLRSCQNARTSVSRAPQNTAVP